MKAEMRKKLAQEPFAEKIRKVAQLIRLSKTFARPPEQPRPTLTASEVRSLVPTMFGSNPAFQNGDKTMKPKGDRFRLC